MAGHFEIDEGFIAEHNKKAKAWVTEDYENLGRSLRRRGVEIEDITSRTRDFRVAIPSWGVGTGGTRFARFPGRGEPRHVFDKLQDCGVIQQLARATPSVSLHIPWDKCRDYAEMRQTGAACGLSFDAMNSNTFSD